jgi:hypothetical protein
VLFLESSARWLLVLHAVLGTALVAATTHLAVWTRSWPSGRFARARGVRWFGAIILLLYAANFTLGNLVYPVYKVRVRAEYFDLLPATTGEAELRAQARRTVAERNHAVVPDEPRHAPDLRPVARLFDIKEHWAAIGLPLAFLVFGLSRRTPEPNEIWTGRLLFWSAIGAASCAWAAALIGLWVSAIRAIP